MRYRVERRGDYDLLTEHRALEGSSPHFLSLVEPREGPREARHQVVELLRRSSLHRCSQLEVLNGLLDLVDEVLKMLSRDVLTHPRLIAEPASPVSDRSHLVSLQPKLGGPLILLAVSGHLVPGLRDHWHSV